MAKISNNNIKVWHKDIAKNYDVSINYSQWHHFYAAIPAEFQKITEHLSDEEQKKLFIVSHKTSKYRSELHSHVVEAETEADCLNRITEALKILVDKAIVQRKVIIVFYNPKDTCQYNDHHYNDMHPQIGLQFGLTYAIETSVGEKKVYSTYTSYKSPFNEDEEEIVNRHELNLYSKSSVIIPDTDENRVMLEQLYGNLKILIKKLDDFTSTPEKMLEFISSNVKMLNM